MVRSTRTKLPSPRWTYGRKSNRTSPRGSEFERRDRRRRGLSWQTNTGLRARACYEQHCTLSSAGFITWIDMNSGRH